MGFDTNGISNPGFPVFGSPVDLVQETLKKKLEVTPEAQAPQSSSSLAPAQPNLAGLEKNHFSSANIKISEFAEGGSLSELVNTHVELNKGFESAIADAEKLAPAGEQLSSTELTQMVTSYRKALDVHRQFPERGDKKAQIVRQERLDQVRSTLSFLSGSDMLAIDNQSQGKSTDQNIEGFEDLTKLAMGQDKASKADKKIASKKPSLPKMSSETKDIIQNSWDSIVRDIGKYSVMPESPAKERFAKKIGQAYADLQLFDSQFGKGAVSRFLRAQGQDVKLVAPFTSTHEVEVAEAEYSGLSVSDYRHLNALIKGLSPEQAQPVVDKFYADKKAKA